MFAEKLGMGKLWILPVRLFPRDFELEKRGDHARAAVFVRMRDVGARGELAR